jgi:DNA-binding transcriptional LysR family regulator
MEYRHLRTFLTVVRERTVTDAAIALSLAPSSVSQQIRVLEASLGVPLFVRKPSGMELTDAGSRMLDWAPRLLEEAERARRDVAGTRQTLRFGALETLIATQVPAVLNRMEAHRPDLRIDVVRTPSRDDLLNRLVTGDLDAGLIMDASGPLGSLGFRPPKAAESLLYTDVETVPVVLAARADHPLVQRDSVSVDDVRDHRLILGPMECSFHMAADHFFGVGGDRIEVPSVFVARSWAAQGRGITLLPEFVVGPDLISGVLVRLNLIEEPPEIWLRLVWRPDRESEPDLRDLLYAVSTSFIALL